MERSFGRGTTPTNHLLNGMILQVWRKRICQCTGLRKMVCQWHVYPRKLRKIRLGVCLICFERMAIHYQLLMYSWKSEFQLYNCAPNYQASNQTTNLTNSYNSFGHNYGSFKGFWRDEKGAPNNTTPSESNSTSSQIASKSIVVSGDRKKTQTERKASDASVSTVPVNLLQLECHCQETQKRAWSPLGFLPSGKHVFPRLAEAQSVV